MARALAARAAPRWTQAIDTNRTRRPAALRAPAVRARAARTLAEQPATAGAPAPAPRPAAARSGTVAPPATALAAAGRTAEPLTWRRRTAGLPSTAASLPSPATDPGHATQRVSCRKPS